MYSGVVIAVGAQSEWKLEIPGEEKHVISAKDMVSWYNSEADFIDKFDIDLKHTWIATIIGNGNVSLDIAWLLLWPHSHLL